MKVKTITHVPGWVDAVKGADKINSVNDAFSLVPLVYRCVDLRAGQVAAMPYTLTRGETPVEYPYANDFRSLLWNIAAALSLNGQAFILKLNNGMRVVGLQWLNPNTMTANYNGGVMTYTQTIGASTTTWPADEIIHIKNFAPENDLTDGVAPAESALQAARLLHYMDVFVDKFFEGGAMPAVILGVEGNPSPDEVKRLESRFSRAITGVKQAFGITAVRGAVSPQVITPPLDTLALQELRSEARLSVAQAFGVPVTMVSDAANYATAKEHRLSFIQDTIMPELSMIEAAFNQQLFDALGFALIFNPQGLDIMQEDEAARAQSLASLTSAGTPLKLAMEILGYDLTDEQWAALETATEAQPMPNNPADGGAVQSLRGDIAKWRRKAIKAMKAGNVATFVSDVIPAGDTVRLYVALSHCHTSAAIEHVFEEYEGGGIKAVIGYDENVPSSQLAMEQDFIPQMQTFLLEDAQTIAATYNSTGKLPDKEEERKKYAAFIAAFLTIWAMQAISETAAALGAIGAPVTADVNALAARWANKHALELAKGLSDTTINLGRQEIARWLLSGETQAQLSANLAEIIGPRWRAEMIAQTEVSRAINAAVDEIGKELAKAGYDVRYVYRTAQDERVCPICSPMHGKKRKPGGEYAGGNRPPQHPRCRCREFIEVIE